MRRLSLLVGLIAFAACGPKEQPAVDTAATAMAAPTISLADVAGSWTIRNMAENNDSVLVTTELTATADPAGWVQLLPGRPPLPMRVRVDGDSIMTEMGPFESVLRPGTQVTTNGVYRLENGMLRGTTTAHYKTAGADSVQRLRSEGTRKQ
jgi:hypothetical protein